MIKLARTFRKVHAKPLAEGPGEAGQERCQCKEKGRVSEDGTGTCDGNAFMFR